MCVVCCVSVCCVCINSALIGLLLAACASASDVVDLSGSTFDSAVSGKPTLVKFYAPWCGHCKNLAPVWDAAATALKADGVQVAKVDCTQHAPLCSEFSVEGYPTLLFHDKLGQWREYDGARSLDALKAYVKSPTGKLVSRDAAAAAPAAAAGDDDDAAPAGPTKVLALDAASFDATLNGKAAFIKFYAPWCGFCKRIAPTWDELSIKLDESKSDTKVVKVDCTVESNKQLCSSFRVGGYPTLVFLQADGTARLFEGGERTIDKLLEFARNPITGPIVDRPYLPKTGIKIFDDNYPMFREDILVLYKFKKLALGVVFGVGVLVGLILSVVLCGGKSASNKKKTE